MWQKAVLNAFREALNAPDWEAKITEAEIYNPWFTNSNTKFCIENWKTSLEAAACQQFIDQYSWADGLSAKTLGLILAGNIPMVGMHDVLCGLCAGYSLKIKTSSDDKILVEYWIKTAIEIFPELKNKIEFAEQLKQIDVAIATGSNNSARYFEYYFKSIPHILRKNRNSVAVIEGNETDQELKDLSTDIFSYFGLGCRNVTHVLLPENYHLKPFIDGLEHQFELIHHFKYSNNYQYHKALLLMNLDPHLDNGFLIIKETPHLYSPVGMLGYSFYKNELELNEFLKENTDQIQCVVGNKPGMTKFGNTQKTTLLDYADNIDTVAFLLKQIQ